MKHDGVFDAYDGRASACDGLRRPAPLTGAAGAVTARASARHFER
jgi:hypothetical protein